MDVRIAGSEDRGIGRSVAAVSTLEHYIPNILSIRRSFAQSRRVAHRVLAARSFRARSSSCSC